MTEAFFPSLSNRLRQKIPIFPQFTTVNTGHGKLRSYLHRVALTYDSMCPCEEEEEEEEEDKTTDNSIFSVRNYVTKGMIL